MRTATERKVDFAAFEHIWEQRRQHLYAMCLRWTGGDRAEAEDALSRIAIKALEDYPDHGARVDNYGAWLTRLAYNLCVDMHRERASYGRAMERFATERQFVGSSVAEVPEDAQLRREAHDVILRAIDTLPPGLLDVCRLRFIEDLPYEQIAARLTLSEERTRKRVQRARAHLHEALTPYLRHGAARRERRDGGVTNLDPSNSD